MFCLGTNQAIVLETFGGPTGDAGELVAYTGLRWYVEDLGVLLEALRIF